jgi:hypothetical protein
MHVTLRNINTFISKYIHQYITLIHLHIITHIYRWVCMGVWVGCDRCGLTISSILGQYINDTYHMVEIHSPKIPEIVRPHLWDPATPRWISVYVCEYKDAGSYGSLPAVTLRITYYVNLFCAIQSTCDKLA